MKYFKTKEGRLIQFNSETNTYKFRDHISHDDPRISIDEFNNMNCQQIKKDVFSRLMNEYFRDVKHSWIYQGTKFRKIDNFEKSKFSVSSNYIIGKDIPLHELEDKKYFGKLVLVYHWGRIYYHTISYGGYPQGQLINPSTFELVRWAQLKHCSPIFNETTKKIC